jgi:hypothetical protein
LEWTRVVLGSIILSKPIECSSLETGRISQTPVNKGLVIVVPLESGCKGWLRALPKDILDELLISRGLDCSLFYGNII